MPISKGDVQILTEQGEPVGRGFGYLHLTGRPLRPVSGSITKMRWVGDLARPGQAYQVLWSDGARLAVTCTRCEAACGPAIFKFAVVASAGQTAAGSPGPQPKTAELP